MDAVLERIAAWEAAGLIDAETAMRLRADEADRPAPIEAAEERPANRRGPSTIGQIFGPSVAIGEMFAYLGGAFLLGAYNVFLARIAGFGASSSEASLAAGYALAALGLTGIGLFLRLGDARRGRAAGLLFAVAVAHVAAAGFAVAGALASQFQVAAVVAALLATAAAIGLRAFHPAVTTQFGLLASLTGLAAAVLAWIEWTFVPEPIFSETGVDVAGRPDPIILLVVSAAWWLGIALVIGLIGLMEARRSEDPAAGRRAGLTRLWAGLTAVAGLATAVMRSDYVSSPIGDYARVLEPWVGDLALIVLALVLVERAFRRGANTFVYAAALALMIGLSDFNFSYLTDSTEAGLLVEGLILLGAGFGADRLRRRIGGDERAEMEAQAPAPA